MIDQIVSLLDNMPGSFKCEVCGFSVEVTAVNVTTGGVETRVEVQADYPAPCPKDGQLMRRLTWKEGYELAFKRNDKLLKALDESVKLQSHYAGVLNAWDGGQRRQFSGAADWYQRLSETGTI